MLFDGGMDVSQAILLLSTGFLAGLLGGLLGIGGGIVLMPALRFVVGLPAPLAAGNCIAGVFFTTLGGSYRHHRLGHLHLRPLWPMLAAGGATTLLCSFAFPKLARHPQWLDLGVGVVFSLISLRILSEGLRRPAAARAAGASGECGADHVLLKGAIGAGGGILPGLLGIGTGVILVPALTYVLRLPIKTAMAFSLAGFCLNACLSATFKLVQGFVQWQVAIPIGLGALLGANLGTVLNRRWPSRLIKLLFGVIFIFVSLKFILAAGGGRT
jgi:uncharacterized membrane protein YfcA